jgi:hypothetical protein
VPPNTIDFSSVFAKFKNLSDNAGVFATVLSIIGLYIILAIFARYKDKKDLIKVKIKIINKLNFLEKFMNHSFLIKIVGCDSFI